MNIQLFFFSFLKSGEPAPSSYINCTRVHLYISFDATANDSSQRTWTKPIIDYRLSPLYRPFLYTYPPKKKTKTRWFSKLFISRMPYPRSRLATNPKS